MTRPSEPKTTRRDPRERNAIALAFIADKAGEHPGWARIHSHRKPAGLERGSWRRSVDALLAESLIERLPGDRVAGQADAYRPTEGGWAAIRPTSGPPPAHHDDLVLSSLDSGTKREKEPTTTVGLRPTHPGPRPTPSGPPLEQIQPPDVAVLAMEHLARSMERLADAIVSVRAVPQAVQIKPAGSVVLSDEDPCTACGSPVTQRTNNDTGAEFLGCTDYPRCNETRSLKGKREAPTQSFSQADARDPAKMRQERQAQAPELSILNDAPSLEQLLKRNRAARAPA